MRTVPASGFVWLLPLASMRRLPVLCLVFVFGLCAGLPALFAADQAQGDTEQPVVTVRCRLLSLGEPIRNLSTYSQGRLVPLHVPNGTPGPVMTYQGARQISFYETPAEAVATTGEGDAAALAGLTPVAQTTLPAGKTCLLLFLPSAAPDEPLRVAAIPLDEERFTGDSFFFRNFTPETIAVNLDGETVVLQPRHGLSYLHAKAAKTNSVIRLAKKNEQGSPSLFYQSRWSPPEGRRTWVFFLPGSNGQIRIERFYDNP